MNIIGLGQAGCNIADKFNEHSQYNTYKIDVELKKSNNYYKIRKEESPEKYEENCPNLKNFFKEVDDDVLFVGSHGDISGATLRILEQLKKKKRKISFIYVRTDKTLLSGAQLLQENLVFNVLQEYARSGLLEKLWLIENVLLSEIIQETTVYNYYDRMNDLIVSTIHMINIFNNSPSIMNTFSPPLETARISTFGLVDYTTGKEKLFFNLDSVREKKYYYAIPEEILKSDGVIMKKVTNQLKNNRNHDKMRFGYGIYETDYNESYVYCESNSSTIQKNK